VRRVAWGCGRTGGVAPSTPGRPADELEADFSPASGSELGWAENAVGAARAQRRCAERAERAAAENGRARRAWVDGDGVPVGHTGRPRNGKEGEGLPMAAGGGQDPVRRVGDLEAVGAVVVGGVPALGSGSVTAAGRPDRRGSTGGCAPRAPGGGNLSVSQRGAAARRGATRQVSWCRGAARRRRPGRSPLARWH